LGGILRASTVPHRPGPSGWGAHAFGAAVTPQLRFGMRTQLLPMGGCSSCHGKLDRTILEADCKSRSQEATSPFRDGIGVFLRPDLPREDLWQMMDRGLTQYLRCHPDVDRQLREIPLETLGPLDQFF